MLVHACNGFGSLTNDFSNTVNMFLFSLDSQCSVLLLLEMSSKLLDTGVLIGLLPYQQTLLTICVLSIKPSGRLFQLLKKCILRTSMLWFRQISNASIYVIGGQQRIEFTQTKLKGISGSSDRHYREE